MDPIGEEHEALKRLAPLVGEVWEPRYVSALEAGGYTRIFR